VEDISNELVVVLAPTDNANLDINTVTFSWEPLEFADDYHFQIAFPNFDSAEQIVEDTTTVSTSFTKTLSSNSYQWRVKAKNFGYETLYTTQNLNIED
jgi:hypothetical protein